MIPPLSRFVLTVLGVELNELRDEWFVQAAQVEMNLVLFPGGVDAALFARFDIFQVRGGVVCYVVVWCVMWWCGVLCGGVVWCGGVVVVWCGVHLPWYFYGVGCWQRIVCFGQR